MKVLIAPDKFKGTLTSREAADAIAAGVRRGAPRAILRVVPLADGGDGTAEVLTRAAGGTFRRAKVTGPLGRPVLARWGLVRRGGRRVAVLEMAAASGLVLVPPARRDPLRTTTYGTGELLLAAFDAGCREIVIGLGGSATVDGGLGFAQALGARLFDGRGRVLPAPATGRELAAVASIDFSRLDRRIAASSIRAACDVTNPLCGPRGAARVYGPQKGATAAQVRRLERGLVRLGAIFRRKTGRSVAAMAGSGAAGGLGAALVAVAGARLVRGADLIFSETGVPALMDWADLVLTGEGNADAQSVQGKTVGALAHLARVRRRTLAVLAGGLGPGAEKLLDAGATELIAVGDPRLSAKQNLARTRDNLSRAAADVAACFAKNGGLT